MFVSRADVCSVPQCGQRPSSSRSDDPIDWWPAHVTCATSMGESSSLLLARTQPLPSNEMRLAMQCSHPKATTLYSPLRPDCLCALERAGSTKPGSVTGRCARSKTLCPGEVTSLRDARTSGSLETVSHMSPGYTFHQLFTPASPDLSVAATIAAASQFANVTRCSPCIDASLPLCVRVCPQSGNDSLRLALLMPLQKNKQIGEPHAQCRIHQTRGPFGVACPNLHIVVCLNEAR